MCRLIDDSRVNPLIALANKSPKTRTGSSRSETPAALAHVHNTVPVSFTTRVGKGAKRPTPDSNYFCDGLAEEIIGGLTKVPGIRPSNHRPFTCAAPDNHLLFSFAFQLVRSVKGAERSAGSELMRNRPSGATSYCKPPASVSLMRVWKRTRGALTDAVREANFTAINFLSG
jgi:hypothetical protein